MKKLLIGLFAAASASIAAHASPISGTSFEGVALKDFGGSASEAIAVNNITEDDNTTYWEYESATDGQKVGWFTNRTDNAEGQWGAFADPGYYWNENDKVGLPSISGGNFATDEKYLKLDANTRINFRMGSGSGSAQDMEDVYFDAMVQFTPTYEAPDLDDADKIAVWLYGSDGEDGIKDKNNVLIEGTNIVVTAGFIDGAYPTNVKTTNTKHYFTTKEIEPNTWHRVTIKAIKNISSGDINGYNVSGFVVFIDGVAVSTAAGVAREDVDGATPVFSSLTANAQTYNSKNALFPSRATDTTISLAGFIGTGALDDVSFIPKADKPAFVEDLSTFTIQWGEGLASLTIPGVEFDFTAGEEGSVEIPYVENTSYTVTATPQTGYCNATWTFEGDPVERTGNSGTFSPTKPGVAIVKVVPTAATITKNDVTTEYPDFISALEGAGDGDTIDTIKIANNISVGTDWSAAEITKKIVIDLNGKSFETTGDYLFDIAEGGSVKIVSSVAGGQIIYSGESADEGLINVGEGGSLIIGDKSGDTGVTIDGCIDNSGSLSLVRGSFSQINADMGYFDAGDGNYAVATGSKVTAPAEEGGFYSVAPEAAALTIQITSVNPTTYDQEAHRPEFVVKQGDTTISEGYTIAWTKDDVAIASPSFIEAGAYKATVTYEGATATATYTIAPLSIKGATVTFETAAYTGSAITPAVKSIISVDGLTVPVADVEASSSETIQNVGEYTVTITAIGSNYTGSTTATLTVSQKTVIATVQLAKYEDYYVEGLKLPNVTSIGFGGDTLVENTDYTVAWDKNAITEPQDSAEIYTLTVSPVAKSNYTFDAVTATYKVWPEQTTPEPGKYVGPGGGEFTLPAEATAPAGKKWSDTVTVDGADITYAQAYALNLTISETGEVSGTIKTSIAIVDGKVVLDVQGKEGYTFTAKFFKSTDLKTWSETATIDSGAEGGDAVGENGKAFYKVSITTIKINDAKAE